MADKDSNDGGTSDRALATAGAASLAARFIDRADLTVLTLADLVIADASVQQALFSETLFRNCTFKRCNFRRADFEGAVFESCTFDDCDFSIADLRSVEAAHTRFIQCKFDEGSTRSSRFSQCEFDRCRMELHNFEENRIVDSIFSKCSFERSTILHCDFSHTTFQETDLADCTSQFHLFKECIFVRSRINAEAIGLTFGLTDRNLHDLGLVWRGTNVERQDAGPDLAVDLLTTYVARNWLFAAGILKLNFGIGHRVDALADIFSALETTATSARPIKTDEVRFFAAVIEQLSAQAQMPFISIARGLDVVLACAELRGEKDVAALKPLYHALKDAELAELGAVERAVAPLESMKHDSQLSVSFVFREEPPLSFHNWLANLHSDGLLAGPAPRFLRAVQGSYIEFFYITVGVLGSVLICLNLIERIVDRLVFIRARGQILISEKIPPAIRKRALQPIAAPSPTIPRELKAYLDLAASAKSAEFVSNIQEFAQRLTKIEVGSDVEPAS